MISKNAHPFLFTYTNPNLYLKSIRDQPLLGLEAGPLSTDPPMPGLAQSGGVKPGSQWHWFLLLQTPCPEQLPGHCLAPSAAGTATHLWLTHIWSETKRVQGAVRRE